MPWKNPSFSERKKALIGTAQTLKSMYRECYSSGVRKFMETSYKRTSSYFKAIHNCDPSDWLLNHKEGGQSYEDFWRACLTGIDYKLPYSSATSLKTQRKTICILPIGLFPTDQLQYSSSSSDDGSEQNDVYSPLLYWLKSYCSAFFHTAKVVMLPSVQLNEVGCDYRVNEFTGRFQLNAYDILSYLRRRKTDRQHCLVAVTMIDLFPKSSWNFVFGLASTLKSCIGGVGVFSFCRYDNKFYETWSLKKDIVKRYPDGSLDYSIIESGHLQQKSDLPVSGMLLLRACKVMTHEVCHMFGLKHCIWMKCLMNGSNHLEESDRRPPQLCPVCLRKLQSILNFDVLERYQVIYKWTTKKSWMSGGLSPVSQSPKFKRKHSTGARPKSSTKSRKTLETNDNSQKQVSLRTKRSGSFRKQRRSKTDIGSLTSLSSDDRAEITSTSLPAPPLEDFKDYRNWLWEAIEFIVCDGKPAMLSHPSDEL